MIFSSKKLILPDPKDALPGRTTPMPVTNRHFVTRQPDSSAVSGNYGAGIVWHGLLLGGGAEILAMSPGCSVRQLDIPAATRPIRRMRKFCTGLTGHSEVVKVIYDPAIVSYGELLRIFWESHNPTQGMRQGNDIGTQYQIRDLYLYSATIR